MYIFPTILVPRGVSEEMLQKGDNHESTSFQLPGILLVDGVGMYEAPAADLH
jgi:hypothetical protein